MECDIMMRWFSVLTNLAYLLVAIPLLIQGTVLSIVAGIGMLTITAGSTAAHWMRDKNLWKYDVMGIFISFLTVFVYQLGSLYALPLLLVIVPLFFYYEKLKSKKYIISGTDWIVFILFSMPLTMTFIKDWKFGVMTLTMFLTAFLYKLFGQQHSYDRDSFEHGVWHLATGIGYAAMLFPYLR